MSAPVRNRGFHLFVYGTLRSEAEAASALLGGSRRVATATVNGTLYDIDGEYPALILYGATPVAGEIIHIPDSSRLHRIDEYEGVDSGLFRRVAVEVAGVPCWAYVAGPALAHRLTPERRLDGGVWARDPA